MQTPYVSCDRTDRACFWHGSFLSPVLHCVLGPIRKFKYLQNKGISLWNFVPNSGLGKLRHGTSIVAMCCQLRSTSVEPPFIHSFIQNTRNGRRLTDKLGLAVYRTERPPLPIARRREERVARVHLRQLVLVADCMSVAACPAYCKTCKVNTASGSVECDSNMCDDGYGIKDEDKTCVGRYAQPLPQRPLTFL